jgi:mevalonate kinase
MKAIAPGKLILSGEHAVVCGRPALAMAIDRSVEAVITPAAGDAISFDLADYRETESFTLRALEEMKRRIAKSYRLFLDGDLSIREVLRKPVELLEFAFINILDGLHLKLAGGLDVRIKSSIPIGCGLGSSAASVLSMVRAVGHYFRVDFRPDWYYAYSIEVEKMQHGHPSGVDSYVSLHGGAARFQDGRASKIPLPRLPLALVNTGTPETTTGECVAAVRARFAQSAVWDEFGRVTDAMEGALREDRRDDVAACVRENHRLLREIGVVPDRVAAFVDEIERAGGAAKICGAGAVRGDAAGAVMVCGARPTPAQCAAYGYRMEPVRGEPLGVRVV